MSTPLPPFGPEQVSRILPRLPWPAACVCGGLPPCRLPIGECPTGQDALNALLLGYDR
jgi:hypothetical protein